VDEGPLEAPLLEQLRDQIDRVALADAAEIDADPVGGGPDLERLGVDVEPRQAGADRDVEGAAGQLVHVPRDHEALERSLADADAGARREVIDSRDVAVGPEPAQLAFEAIDEGEGGLRRLRRVSCVGARHVDLEHGVHGLVREAPKRAGRAVAREPDPALDVHRQPTIRASSPPCRSGG